MRSEVYQALMAARASKRPVVLVTDLNAHGQVLLDGESETGDLELNAGQRETALKALKDDRSTVTEDGLFLHVFNPPLRLLIVGAVHIAQALIPMARLAGYDVTLIDPRRAWATEERFPDLKTMHDWPDDALDALEPDRRTAVVALTHDPKLDDPALMKAIRSPAFYVGALGSTRTHAKRRERLAESGTSEEEFKRIHGPIGLSIGAKSPAEIAVSILAQMTQVLRGAPPLIKAEE